MAQKFNLPKDDAAQLEGMLGRKYSHSGEAFNNQDGEEPPLPYSTYLREKVSGIVWPWSRDLARRRDLVENHEGPVNADMSEDQKYFERKYRTAESQEEYDAIDTELQAFVAKKKAEAAARAEADQAKARKAPPLPPVAA